MSPPAEPNGTLSHNPNNDPSLNFSAPAETHPFAALLFDMDGTIIDSTPAIIKYWMRLGEEIGVSGATILETSHGRRSIDVLSILAPEKANWDFVCQQEGRVPVEFRDDATEVPGARSLLAGLEGVGANWAIVTSGTKPLVEGWLGVMGLERPRVLVSAEQVSVGKPEPEGYLLGAERLGVGKGNGEVLVLEDAPAGVRAGKAAGFRVVAVATTHEVKRLREAGADWIVRDLRSLRVVRYEGQTGRVEIEVRDALVG